METSCMNKDIILNTNKPVLTRREKCAKKDIYKQLCKALQADTKMEKLKETNILYAYISVGIGLELMKKCTSFRITCRYKCKDLLSQLQPLLSDDKYKSMATKLVNTINQTLDVIAKIENDILLDALKNGQITDDEYICLMNN